MFRTSRLLMWVGIKKKITKAVGSSDGQIDHSQALPDHEVKVCVDLDGDPCLAEAEKNLTSVFSSYGNAQEKFHLRSWSSSLYASPHHLLF